MVNPITVVNGSVLTAPAPPTLQRTGAAVSQGATTLAPQTYKLITQYSDLTSVLQGAEALTSLTWSGGTVTATATSPHGLTGTVWLTIVGASPAAYNGSFPCTVTGASTFTYPLASNPGSETTPGTYTEEDVGELVAQITTFFGMGSQVAVYVLELGAGSTSAGVTALSNFINNTTPQFFYIYLVPRTWAGDSTFITFADTFTSVTGKTYFGVTANLQNYPAWVTAGPKSVLALIEAPASAVWPANALTAISWSANFMTATTTTAHGVSPGQWFQISGCTPTGYNGWYLAAEGTTAETLVAFLAANPGSETGLGTLVASVAASSGVGVTEFDLAGVVWTILGWNPASSNPVTSLSFANLNAATPFPLQGNSSLLTTLLTSNINYVGLGSEGGISTAILRNGRTLDGNQFNFWYAYDWMQINGDLDVTNAVIVGSQNGTLWNNQNGVTALQGVLAQTVSTGIGANLILGSLTLTELSQQAFLQNIENGAYPGQAVVNAVPWATYYGANPGNYKLGIYGGFQVAIIPQTGFQQIIVNIMAVQIPIGA